jgi:tetratricopeptide (TPR) repeat protein
MSISEIAKLESRWRENPYGLTFAPLAEAYRKQKDPQRALEILTPGLEKHPDYIPANIVLGRCHWDLNDLPGAERAFSYVLGLDGENVIALKALADLTERLMRYEEAERWLETLLGVDRSNDEARDQLERIRELQRERAEGSAAIPGAGVVLEEPAGVPHLDTVEPEHLVIDEPRAPPEAFESTPEPPTADDAGPVEYIGWVAKPDDGPPSADPLPLEELGAGDEVVGSPASMTYPVEDEPAEPEALVPDMPSIPSPPNVDAFGIEQSEEIVLNVSGPTEYQTASAVDDLMADVTGTPIGSIDDLRRDLAPPEPITSALSEPEPESPMEAAEPIEVEPPPVSGVGRTADFYALDEPPSRFSAAEELGDAPAVAEPELVVTETMAEVLLSQGHLAEALTVYRELARRSPGAPQLAGRVADLEARQAVSPTPAPRPPHAARDTGGQSVASLLQNLLAARPGDPPVRWPSRAEPAVEPAPEAASATRPAGEPLSLGSVFGEEPSPNPPAVRNSADSPGSAASVPPVSFDDFFGSAPGVTSGAPSSSGRNPQARRGDDLDQFHAWLQSLKR